MTYSLKPVKGITILKQIFNSYNSSFEASVETAFSNAINKLSPGKITIRKIKKKWHDGDIDCFMLPNSRKRGIHEAKYNNTATPASLKKQLVQILKYEYDICSEDICSGSDFFILTSCNHCTYVLKKDVIELEEKLKPLYQTTKYSASQIWNKDKRIKELVKNTNINFISEKLTPDFRLDLFFEKLLNNIYN